MTAIPDSPEEIFRQHHKEQTDEVGRLKMMIEREKNIATFSRDRRLIDSMAEGHRREFIATLTVSILSVNSAVSNVDSAFVAQGAVELATMTATSLEETNTAPWEWPRELLQISLEENGLTLNDLE